MRRRKVDATLERQFITAMIVNKPFLSSVVPIADLTLLESKPLQQVARWCVEHFRQYEEPPGRGIEARYHSWVENEHPEDEEAEAMGDFLTSLSSHYDTETSINVAYLLDEFGKYLTLRRVALLKDNLETALLQGDQVAAAQHISDFQPVRGGGSLGFNPLTDRSAWERAFAEPIESEIPFPGAAGQFFRTALTRDGLIGIQGPEKRGKTFWCLEFLYRALLARKKVAMFEVGDLSEAQLTTRLGMRLARLPLWKKQMKGVDYPTRLEVTKEGDEWTYEVEHDTLTFPNIISNIAAWKAIKTFNRRCKLPKEHDYLMLSIHANSSINVAGIRGILDQWESQSGFIPSIIIIDYADILAPEDDRKDARHQVNDTWKALRRLSQERHCLVITPTQANAASYNVQTQKMSNFSEDKRKLAHVTGMLGLNQTESEKKDGIMRLNWLALRESDFHSNTCLWVAQCLPLAQALVQSAM